MRSVNRILVNMLLDGALAAVAAPIARWLADPHGGLIHPLWFLAGGAITLLVGGIPFRMPQQYWRFSGIADLLGIAGGSVISAALFAAGLVLTGYMLPSITFPIIHALTLLVLLGGLRIVYRLSQRRPSAGLGVVRDSVLLIGADEAADLFLRAVKRDAESRMRVSGLIGHASHQPGRRIQGVPILGTVRELGAVLDRLVARGKRPDGLVVTDPDLRGEALAAVMEAADRVGVPVRRVPNPTALSPAARVELRPVAIEDLLNRPQVPLDREAMAAFVRGRRVLVTGAGGSIGSEMARQVAALDPAELVLLDNGEYALWQIEQELDHLVPSLLRRTVIADVRDAERIAALFGALRPELVFHAAALKHVPMVEANPGEGMLTNAVGTLNVADAARAAGAAAMVLISTDKAVNPSSLMGASKRAAEMYCQAMDIVARRAGRGLRCVTVRFGNVLGSTGSVVPLFRRQLERGGPLTVTHADMQRYFMTVPEAVGLVLEASALATGHEAAGRDALGEEGGIFVLDMGRPVKIVDLARQMIRLAGLRPEIDVPIRFTGLRPGEKLFEELFHGREPPVPTPHAGLLIARPRVADLDEVRGVIAGIGAACRANRPAEAIALLRHLVPEFNHNISGVPGEGAPSEGTPHEGGPGEGTGRAGGQAAVIDAPPLAS
ncbi:polysaccharide biosynthesis protein [Rhizosaccharibacter radicis]|uniref:Polysaccharide biosynthesis protein n=1 Tax=Rhizosaccharibacter radicis TaxID=2782605 RepID=A0ABT1VVV4_9PROT|nr:polysaccharide biosynthesis protein [Acetobacteraceae bacterium KSS12]